MKNKTALFFTLIWACVVLLPGNEPVPAKIVLPFLSAGAVPLQPNGDFVISVERLGRWQEAGHLSNDRFLRQQRLDLAPWLQGARKAHVRIRQAGGGASHLDAVLLGGEAPLSVENGELKKISHCDNDLTPLSGGTVDLTFAASSGDHVLTVAGRIESKVIGTEPLQFPVINTFRKPSAASSFYSYRLYSAAPPKQRFGGRDWLAEVGKRQPFFADLAPIGSGHPTGCTYGWVSNDAHNLYVTVDFTPDNTYDGDKDYAKVFVRGNGQLREFKVSVPEKRWGRAHFVYTDKVAYQHKVYDFVIPLSALPGGAVGQDLDLCFAAYGTASAMSNISINLAYDPNLRRYLAVLAIPGGSTTDIYGVFVDEDGNLIGVPFPIAQDAGNDEILPDVAYDRVNRRFMVIWQMVSGTDGSSTLAGRIYRDDGVLYNPGMIIGGTSDKMYSPTLAFDEVNQRYLVVWVISDDTTYSWVRGQMRDSGGFVVGGLEIHISPPEAYAGTVDLAFDSQSQLYMAVWDANGGMASPSPVRIAALPAGDQITAQMITSDGALAGEPFGVTTGSYVNWMPAIANDNTNHRFLVAFVQLPGTASPNSLSIGQYRERFRGWAQAALPSSDVIVAGQLLDSLGALQGDAFGIGMKPGAFHLAPRLAFDPVHGRYLAIWHELELPSLPAPPGPPVSSLVGQFLDGAGAPLETDPAENFTIDSDSIFFVPPALACNTFCGNFLAVWMGTSGGIAVLGGGCPQPPAVETLPVTAVTTTGAQGGGNVTADGGANVFGRGVCWNAAGSPTIFDPHSSDGSGLGIFSSSLGGLLPATTYHVRAYASNSVGTAYGDEVVFTTFRWMVTFAADAGGTLAGPTPQYVNSGGNCLPVQAAAKAGYYFRKWDGNNAFSSLANPLIVTNVLSDLAFYARFGLLGISVNRRIEQAWIIKTEYADVQIEVNGLAGSGAAKFLLMRKVSGGGWEAQKEILPGDFVDGHYSFASLPLEKGKPYSFRIEAYGGSGALLGVSAEVTI
jgi:hypothetical protein